MARKRLAPKLRRVLVSLATHPGEHCSGSPDVFELERRGFVSQTGVDITDNGARKLYGLTDKGRNYAADVVSRVERGERVRLGRKRS